MEGIKPGTITMYGFYFKYNDLPKNDMVEFNNYTPVKLEADSAAVYPIAFGTKTEFQNNGRKVARFQYKQDSDGKLRSRILSELKEKYPEEFDSWKILP